MEEKKETMIHINWGTGNITLIAEKFFPITAEHMTKLYKKCIRLDYEHRETIVEQILESLTGKAEELKVALESQIIKKSSIEQELALARGRTQKEEIRGRLLQAKEQVRLTNSELKQVQKNIEQLKLLSTAKK